MSSQINQVRKLLASSKNIAFLTGAGISSESGIPTFRGAGGYWKNKHFMDLACQEAFDNNPLEQWEWYCERRRTCAAAVPNAAHYAISRFQQIRTDVTLITQNVDGLHERAGSDAVRFHGSLWETRCQRCMTTRSDRTMKYNEVPVCNKPSCRGAERVGVVWFGESLPVREISIADKTIDKCSVLFVIGTSLTVMPAAMYAYKTLARGAKVIEINTKIAMPEANFKFETPAAEVLQLLLE